MMEFKFSVQTNIRTEEFKGDLLKAAKGAMVDVLADMGSDAVPGSPVKTGNNRRSLAYQTSDMNSGKTFETGQLAEDVDFDGRQTVQGAMYSTSGYGGYLETGTERMNARPYMKPAADRHFTEVKMSKLIWNRLERESKK